MTNLSEWKRIATDSRRAWEPEQSREPLGEMINALSVDVEDYFQVAGFSDRIAPSQWRRYRPRVEENTERLLALFERAQVKATFFILGWVAERFPGLVKRIDMAGHEVASHGYSHRLIYTQHPEQFRRETRYTKELLESIVQHPIEGYRAASYSITRRSIWALDVLIEEGFSYDSSVVPVMHDRYGIPGSKAFPHLITRASGQMVEFPPSTMRLFNTRIPVAGGGYFRLYPYHLTRWALSKINRQRQPFIFYIHPWEVDPAQPRIQGSVGARFRHYLNLKKCERRLERLVSDFRFAPVSEALGQMELSPITELAAGAQMAGSG